MQAKSAALVLALRSLLSSLAIAATATGCAIDPRDDEAVILGADDPDAQAAEVDELDWGFRGDGPRNPDAQVAEGDSATDKVEPLPRCTDVIANAPPSPSGAEQGADVDVAYEASPNAEADDAEAGDDDSEPNSPRDRYDAPPRRAPGY